MKIWQMTLLIGLFLSCSILVAEDTPLPASKMVTASNEPYTDPARAITVTADNPEFTIRLKSNPTTGYRWYLKASSNTWLKVITEEYNPGHSSLVGASGEETWHFKVLPQALNARMLLSIEFVSIQPWNMKGDNNTTQTFYVVTEPKE